MLQFGSLPTNPATGELRSLISEFDWQATSFGPRETWCVNLKAAVDIITASPAAMVLLWGPDGAMIYNDGFARIAGHRHPGLLGRSVFEGFAELSDFNMHVLTEVLKGNSLSYRDKHIVMDMGHEAQSFWFDLDYSPVMDDEGNPRGVLSVVVDTTQRVLAERAQQDSEARLQTLADNIAQFAWIADETGHVFWYNKRWFDYSGSSFAEVDGHGWHKFIHPDEISSVVAKISDCFAKGVEWEDTFQLRGRDGTYRWFLSRAMPIRDPDGNIVRWFGTNTDITKERDAAASDAQLATIVSTSADAIISLSPEGEILSWNPGAESLLGYRADEVVGMSETLLFPEGDENEFRIKYAQLRQGKSVQRESVRVHKDGTLVDVAVSAAPIRRSDGRLIGYSAVLRDITERKRADARMRLVTRELSHRTKNLLAVIVSMVRQTARLCTDTEAFQDELVQRLHAMAASHDLLVAGDWAGAPLRGLIDAVLEPFGGSFVKVVQTDGPDIFLNANAIQNIALALHELATNAAKYGAMSVPTGRVKISWKLESRDDDRRVLSFTWTEVGGPPVKKPQRTGFGHVVVDRVIARALEADVSYQFDEPGVVWSIAMPASLVVTRDYPANSS